jgi:hypothetical protein
MITRNIASWLVTYHSPPVEIDLVRRDNALCLGIYNYPPPTLYTTITRNNVLCLVICNYPPPTSYAVITRNTVSCLVTHNYSRVADLLRHDNKNHVLCLQLSGDLVRRDNKKQRIVPCHIPLSADCASSSRTIRADFICRDSKKHCIVPRYPTLYAEEP